MLQITITPETTFTIEAGIFRQDILVGWIVIGVLAALVLMGLFFITRAIARKAFQAKAALEKVILQVMVPKEAAEKAGAEAKETLQEIQEHISMAENLFGALGSLKAEHGLKTRFLGYEETFAFEIVASDGLISFYVAVPRKHLELAKQQIHAQYPFSHIEEVPDYNMFDPQGVVFGTHLCYKRPSFFPIKTYRKIEGDPLESISSALSKIPKQDGVALQYVVRSSKGDWRRYGLKIVREMKKGKSMKEAMKALAFFAKLGEFTPASKKKKEEAVKEPKTLSPMEQEAQKAIEEWASKPGLDVNIRIVTSAHDAATARLYLDNVANAFAQFNIYEYGNILTKRGTGSGDKLVRDFIFRHFDEKKKIVLNAEEMASMFHLPIPETQVPNIRWLGARTSPPPANMPKDGLILGKVVYRGVETPARIKDADRRRHIYIIGKSGVGKTWLLANMARQDIAAGRGLCVIDPHGDLIDDVISFIPDNRVDDVIYFDPSDTDRPIGLNMLEVGSEGQKDFAAQEMIAIFYKLFSAEMIGPLFEHNMRNVMLTLMADPSEPGTIAEIPRMFSDADFQKHWVSKVRDPVVRGFWEKEMAKTSDFHKSEMLGYLISKVGRFVENEMMRNIIGQVTVRGGQRVSGFDLREVMDNQKILLVNLSKGKTGEVNANLLGLILVSKLQMAALSRADTAEAERQDFYLYIDEFQNFITDSIATILSEARKYKLNLIIAHQYMGQLTSSAVVGKEGDPKVRDAVLGNAGTMAAFRIGIEDAEFLEKEFAPVFNKYDLINIEKFTAYVKLLIDNTASRPFAMKTIPLEKGDPERAKAIKQLSRLRYGRDKALVEAEILERTRLGELGKSAGPFYETKK